MVTSLKKKNFKSQKRILIVEDHPVFRDGLVQLLNAENDFMVCGETDRAEKSLRLIRNLKPDLVVVDLELLGKSGLELIKEVRASNLAVKLLVVSMYDEALYADRVLRAGGDGYIMKQESPEEIIHAIRDVLDGHIYVSEEIYARNSKASLKRTSKPEPRRLDQLTDIELNILELLGWGKNNDEIARQLHLNLKKVNSHCMQMRRKLRLKSDNALIRYAVCWVETGEV
jgi:DNA-binding NarL/FixJ family response regulator